MVIEVKKITAFLWGVQELHVNSVSTVFSQSLVFGLIICINGNCTQKVRDQST
jgi:hypothetical protein